MKYKIYFIYTDLDEKKYIGATKQNLSNTLCIHKRESKNMKEGVVHGKNEKLYEAMREKGEEKFKIELLEQVEVESREELTVKINKKVREYETIRQGYNK